MEQKKLGRRGSMNERETELNAEIGVHQETRECLTTVGLANEPAKQFS